MEEKYHTTNIVKNILKNCPSYTTLKIEIVNEIIDYIENNIIVDSENNNNSLSISNISKSLNISVSALQNLFNSECPITIKNYIIRRKMSLASHDLVETDDSILNISIKYGYNPDSFSRAFKKIYKTTPIEYRKNGIITEEFPRLNIKLYVLDDLNLLKTNCSSGNWCILDNNDFICYASNKPISKLQKKYPNGCKSFKYNFESYVKNETLKEKLIKELMNNEK